MFKIYYEIFLKIMVDLVLDKDVLVLISLIVSEKIEFVWVIFLKICENI